MSKQIKPTMGGHVSHGQADRDGHHIPGIGRGAPKRQTAVNPAFGMVSQSKTGDTTLGGDHKSAVDSLSGLVIVPGKDGKAATAHPLTKPPVAKNLARVLPVPGQRSRTNEDCETHADKCSHGADMLAGAVYSGSTPLKRGG